MKRIGSLFLIPILVLAGCGKETEPSRRPAAGGEPAPFATTASQIHATIEAVDIPTVMMVGATTNITFRVKNMGPEAWAAGPGKNAAVRFGYHWADPGTKGNWDSVVWDDSNRGDLSADVPPQGTATVTMKVKALPQPSENCKLVIEPMIELVGWQTAGPFVATISIREKPPEPK